MSQPVSHTARICAPRCVAALLLASLTWVAPSAWAGPSWQALPADAEVNQAALSFVNSIPNRTVHDWKTVKFHDSQSSEPLDANGVVLVYRVPNPDYDPGNADQPDLECGNATLWWAFEDGWRFVGATRTLCFSGSDTLDALVQRFLGTRYQAGWLGAGENRPPSVTLSFTPLNPKPTDTIEFFADASDPDGDALTYAWYVDGVKQNATQSEVRWTNPPAGAHTLRVVVSDGKGGSAEDTADLAVGEGRAPRLELTPPETPELVVSAEYGVTYRYCFHAVSYDEDKDEVVHEWSFDGQPAGGITTVQGAPTETASVASSLACWVPATQGAHTVAVRASDGVGGVAEKEYTFSLPGQWVHVRLKQGEASLQIGGQWYDLEAGTRVSITDGVRSGNVSIRCRAGTIVNLVFADGSQLYFDCRSPSVHDDPGGGDLTVDHSPAGERLEIGPGNVRVRVRDVKITLFEAAGWPGGKEGTEFEIDVRPDGTVTVFTFDGTVWFADPLRKKTVRIGAGEQATGVPGELPSDPLPFAPGSMSKWWEDEPPPSAAGRTLAAALDVNDNGILDDGEIISAIQYWILGTPVPGTGQTISDAQIQQLVQMWILGTPVGGEVLEAAPAASPAVVLGAPGALVREVRAALDTQRLDVRVYDLSGRLLLEQSASGNRLRLGLRAPDGAPLANGVYLVVVTAFSDDGGRGTRSVAKVALLR